MGFVRVGAKPFSPRFPPLSAPQQPGSPSGVGIFRAGASLFLLRQMVYVLCAAATATGSYLRALTNRKRDCAADAKSPLEGGIPREGEGAKVSKAELRAFEGCALRA
jgi:hypothetical protein